MPGRTLLSVSLALLLGLAAPVYASGDGRDAGRGRHDDSRADDGRGKHCSAYDDYEGLKASQGTGQSRTGADERSRRYPDHRIASGLKSVYSGGVRRTFYLDLPRDYYCSTDPKPVIIAYHGTSLSHEAWLNGFYTLRSVVGNGAILIYPDALLNVAAGYTQWDDALDDTLFLDLLARLPKMLRFDPDKIFVTGHSSGAGFTNEMACRHGDHIRAIAPVVGSLTSSTCVGSFAVMTIFGSKDPLAGVSGVARKFWVLYNGFDPKVSIPGAVAPCVDYSLGSADYPVQACVHDEGEGATAHDWPSFAGEAIWKFFSGLNRLAPRTDPPPGGGNARALGRADTTASFTLRFPANLPAPIQGTVVLFPANSVVLGPAQQPSAFMNLSFTLGDIGPGVEKSYNVPVTYVPFAEEVTFPGSYTLGVFIYVEGGSFPQPAPGVDLAALAPVDLVDPTTPVVVPGVLNLEPFHTSP